MNSRRTGFVVSTLLLVAAGLLSLFSAAGPVVGPGAPAAVGPDAAPTGAVLVAKSTTVRVEVASLGAELPPEIDLRPEQGTVVAVRVMASAPRRGTVLVPRPLLARPLLVVAPGFRSAGLSEGETRIEITAFATLMVHMGAGGPLRCSGLLTGPGSPRTFWLSTGGSETFVDLEAGSHVLEVSDIGTRATVRRVLTLDWGERKEVTVDLAAGFPVGGRVVDPTGNGVAGVTMRARFMLRAALGNSEVTAVSGVDGSFMLCLPMGGDVEVSADPPAGWLAPEPVRFHVPCEEEGGLRIRIVRTTGRLEGRVVTTDGSPVEAAEVMVQSIEGVARAARSAPDGAFAVDRLPVGSPVTVVARKPGYDNGKTTAIPDAEPADVVLKPGLTLEVRVVEAGTLRPIKGVRVRAARVFRGCSSPGDRLPVFPGEEEGLFLVTGLAEDTSVLVLATAEGYEPAETRVPPRPAPALVELTPIEAAELTGRVVDESGRPVARIHVFACELSDFSGDGEGTAPDGRFSLSGLRSGHRYRVTAQSFLGDLVSEPVEAVAGDSGDLLIRVLSAGSVSGEIVSRDPSVPVRGGILRVDAFRSASGTAPLSGLLDNQGLTSAPRFREGGYLPGTYDLTVLTVTHAPCTIREVRVAAGRTTSLGRITLDPFARWRIRLLDSSGVPVAGVPVAAVGQDASTWVFRVTDEGGVTERALPGSRLCLVAGGGDLPMVRLLERTLTPGESVADEARFPAAGWIDVRLSDSSGRPAPSEDVSITAVLEPPSVALPTSRILPEPHARMAEGYGRSFLVSAALRSDRQGAVRSPPLAPGEYRLHWRGSETTARVRAGEVTDVTLVGR
ncbi:MAG: carboxypeptidase-like regulatory domain-containing protein [Planctomycetes bacterium]|jgi:hypothetical protein|nr:carboxypeptidase-like regulatory domain-containing protein [Planctomycetota bacterium]